MTFALDKYALVTMSCIATFNYKLVQIHGYYMLAMISIVIVACSEREREAPCGWAISTYVRTYAQPAGWRTYVRTCMGDVSVVFLSISQSALGPLSLSETTYLLSEWWRAFENCTPIDRSIATCMTSYFRCIRGALNVAVDVHNLP